jgi:hypothetical protein
MTTIMQLKRLSDTNFDESYKERFNKWCYQINEQNLMFIRYHYLCERTDTEFWRKSTTLPLPLKLEMILDADYNLIPRTNIELFNTLQLEEFSLNEMTFFVNNYLAIYKKNKKSIKQQLL